MAKRIFGTVNKLPSGKFRARYTHPITGERVSAQITYKTKADANLWLKSEELAIQRGTWRDTRLSADTLDDYGLRCIAHKDLKDTVRDDYLHIWDKHISPFIGAVRMQDLTPEQVRSWQYERLQAGAGKSSISYAYRILKTVCNTALDDKLIRFNPCTIKGASKVKSEPRKALTAEQVAQVADVVPARYRALVLLVAMTGLRFGEATALRLSDLDLSADMPTLKVSRRVKAKRGGGFNFDTPKTQASFRTIPIPANGLPAIAEHIERFVSSEPDALVFPTKLGNPAVIAGADAIRTAFNQLGLVGYVPHGLRHTTATLALANGYSLEQVRDYLGQADIKSTAIYTHAQAQGNVAISQGLSDVFDNVVPLRRRVS